VVVVIEELSQYSRRQLRPPDPAPIPSVGEIVRIDRLHGIVKEYSRAA
jgi:hypothetical protein